MAVSGKHRGWRFNHSTNKLEALFDGEVRLTLDGTGVALNDGTPAAQPSAIVSLTDNSGGTGNDTIAVLTGVDGTGSNAAPLAATADAVADLAAKVNEIIVALRAQGIIAT